MVLFHVFHVEHFSDEQLKKVKWVEIHSEVVYVNLVRETAKNPRCTIACSMYSRCGRVMADDIAYAKFRKSLLNPIFFLIKKKKINVIWPTYLLKPKIKNFIFQNLNCAYFLLSNFNFWCRYFGTVVIS